MSIAYNTHHPFTATNCREFRAFCLMHKRVYHQDAIMGISDDEWHLQLTNLVCSGYWKIVRHGHAISFNNDGLAPDDLTAFATWLSSSIPDLPTEEWVRGYNAVVSADERAMKKHGFSNSPAEAAVNFPPKLEL